MKAKIIIILIVLVCLLTSCSQLLKKGFPQYSGEIKSSGIKQPVEVYRDDYGIPHIYAQNEYDVYFAQGYTHAQDRLWQMELLRRLARGRLSEITGKDTVEVDMFMRLIGIDKAMKRLASEANDQIKRVFDAYVDGINAYIQVIGKKLPLEFSALKLSPEPFTEEDLFASTLLNSWALNTNFSQELLAVRMMNRLTADSYVELFPAYPNAHLPADDYYNSFRTLKVAPFLKAVDVYNGTSQNNSGSTGSNSWVAGGKLSLSGKPILANDPHLAHTIPGVWYLNHLVTPSMNVTGASIPGAPCVIIGHNESIAWGITNVMTDYVDLYVVKTDPSLPTRYFVDNKALEMEQEEIIINVKGSKPEHRTIYHTIHGPVITNVGKGHDVQIALKWYPQAADSSFEGFYNINSAGKVEEAFEGGRYFGIICLNLVVADSFGNIGWHVTGKAPIRKGYSGRLPADGSRSNFGWEGFISYDELPSVFNPPSGVIATSNDRRINDDYPYSISYSWAAPYRVQRIISLLS